MPKFMCLGLKTKVSALTIIIRVVGYFSKLSVKYFLTNFYKGKGKYSHNS